MIHSCPECGGSGEIDDGLPEPPPTPEQIERAKNDPLNALIALEPCVPPFMSLLKMKTEDGGGPRFDHSWFEKEILPLTTPQLCELCTGPGEGADDTVEILEFYSRGNLMFRACSHLARKILQRPMTLTFKTKAERDEENTPHTSGMAVCLACAHEWAFVVPTSDHPFADLTCPKCGCHRGKSKGMMIPNEDCWACACGNDLFLVTRDRVFCPGCGIFQTFS